MKIMTNMMRAMIRMIIRIIRMKIKMMMAMTIRMIIRMMSMMEMMTKIMMTMTTIMIIRMMMMMMEMTTKMMMTTKTRNLHCHAMRMYPPALAAIHKKNMQPLEHTQECEPKYDLWPYKRWNTGGSITKNYRCVDLTMMHIWTKFERNPSRNVACRAHTRFPPKYDFSPYKRRNTGGSITKNNRRVDFTKIHLHTKFERNPSRNAAVRAHTRMWRGGRGGGVTLLNPKYPPAVPAGGYNY